MQSDFTPQLLIKHLYNETTAGEAVQINNELESSAKTREELAQLQEAIEALDEAGGEQPCAMSIHNILEYSRQYQMESV